MIVLQGAQERVRALQFSADGRGLAAPCRAGVQVWAGLAGGPPTAFLAHPHVASVRFTPDGQGLLLRGPLMGLVAVAALPSRRVTSVPLELPTPPAYSDLSPAGRSVVVAQVPRSNPWAAGGPDAWLEVKARLFCRPVADPGSPLWSVSASGRVHHPPLFLPGGERFLTLEWRGGGRLVTRDAGTGAVLSEAPADSALAFGDPVMSPDGRLLGCRGRHDAAVYRVEDPAAAPVTLTNDTPKEFTGLAFHPSGRFLAATSNDATVKLYDTATWKLARAFDWGVGRLRSVAFSPDGMLAAAGNDKGKIVVWDVDL
jgi:hypothetical protein